MIAGLRPLIRALDRRIAEVAGTIPQAQVLAPSPGLARTARWSLCRSPADHALSHAGPSRELCRLSAEVQAIGRAGGAPRDDSRRRESLVRGALVRAVVSHVQHAPDSWLYAVLPNTQGARRVAHGARRRGAEARARHSRDATHQHMLDE